MRKFAIFVACLIFSVSLVSCGGTGELDARIMSVFRVDGETVRLSSGAGGATDARAGMGLHEGYIVSTGLGSFCYISLDADSLVKMDVQTGISIDRLTDRLLRISVNSGQVMVDVQNQNPEHTLETRIGSTVITVRGTVFVAGVYDAGEAIVTVLEGSVYVNEVLLVAGYTMRVYDGVEMIYVIEPAASGVDVFELHRVVEVVELVEDYEEEVEEATEPMMLMISWEATLTPPIQQFNLGDTRFSINTRYGTRYPVYREVGASSPVRASVTGLVTTTGYSLVFTDRILIEVTGTHMHGITNHGIATGFICSSSSEWFPGLQISLTSANIELNGVQLNLHPAPRLVDGWFMVPLRALLEALGMNELYGNPYHWEPSAFDLRVVDGYTFITTNGLAGHFREILYFRREYGTVYMTIR